jgi:hypothetical protein
MEWNGGANSDALDLELGLQIGLAERMQEAGLFRDIEHLARHVIAFRGLQVNVGLQRA